MEQIIKSFTYGQDIDANTAVKFSQEGVVVKATDPTDSVCGIALFSGLQGAKGDILMFGLSRVSTGAAVNAGDVLVASTGAKLIPLDTDDDQGQMTIVAKALETASSAAIVSAFVNPQAIFVPEAEDAGQA